MVGVFFCTNNPLVFCALCRNNLQLSQKHVSCPKALTNSIKYAKLNIEIKASALVPVMGTKGAFCFFKIFNLGGRIYEDQTTAFTKIYPSYHRISLVFLDALADLHALSFLCRR